MGWIIQSFARAISIFQVKWFKSQSNLFMSCILVACALVMLSIEHLRSKKMIYSALILLGLGISTVVPFSFIYVASVFNVENGYMWVFYTGAQLLPMFNPVLCQYWMEQSHEGFIYFNLMTIMLGLVILPFLFSS